MDIGTKLKSKRTQQGLTQEQLASQLRVSRQTVANWEKSKTYPDIGSLLTLSDLYQVSLDELLKEDAQMKQHIQQTSAFSDKLWNSLFVIAVLLLPASMLLNHWGWEPTGTAAKLLGLCLLLLVILVRWKLSGGKKSELAISLFFWGLLAATELVRQFAFQESNTITFEYLFLGIFLLYGYGTWFQTKLAFFLTIAIYFGMPIYVTLSTHLPTIREEGITNAVSDDIFGRHYRAEIIYQAEDSPIPVPAKVTLDQDGKTLIFDHQVIGMLIYDESDPGSSWNTWFLIPTGDPDGRVRLSATKGSRSNLRLSYLVDTSTPEQTFFDTLWDLWLSPLEDVSFLIQEGQDHHSLLMDWYPPNLLSDFDRRPASITLEGSPTAAISWPEPPKSAAVEFGKEEDPPIILTEEYYCGGQMERTQYTLERNEQGLLPLPKKLTKRYPEGEQYADYRIPFENGEYLFRVRYS